MKSDAIWCQLGGVLIGLAAKRRWLLRMLVALPLVLGAVSAHAAQMFVCSGDSIAREECCCPKAARGTPAARDLATVSRGCCCDIVTRLSAAPAPAVVARGPKVGGIGMGPALAFSLPDPTPVQPPVRALPWLLAHPPPPRIPPILEKRTLLI